MIMLSIKLLNDIGEPCRSVEKEFSELKFLSYISALHSKYKSKFYLCSTGNMTLVIIYDNTIFRIEKFNNKWHFRVTNEAQHIFRKCRLRDDKKYLCNQLERAILEKETQYNSKRCAICLEPYGEKIYILACLHKFHPDCINAAIDKKSSCPMCRSKIDNREYL